MAIQPQVSLTNNIHVIQRDTQVCCNMVLGKNYITYCITDQSYKTVFSVKHFVLGNKVVGKSDFDVVLSDTLIRQAIQTNIAIDSHKSVLVPGEIYQQGNDKIYFTHLHDIGPDEIIEKQIFSAALYDLFLIKKSTKQFLSSRLKNVRFYNASGVLLPNYPDAIIHEHQHSLFIHIKEEYIVVTLYQKNNLRLHQSYEWQSLQDIVYFVANIFHQLQIDSQSTGIHIHGEIQSIDSISQELKKYFTQVRFCTRIKEIQYPDTLYAHPAHYFFNLFSIFACVS